MERVVRPKKHRSVCFIEFKDDNGEKEAYVRVAKKFDRLTKDNYKKIFLQKGIENPYKELFSTDDDDKNDKFDEVPCNLIFIKLMNIFYSLPQYEESAFLLLINHRLIVSFISIY